MKASNFSGGRGIIRVTSDLSKFLRDKPKSYHVIPHSHVENVFETLEPQSGVVLQEISYGIEFSIDCYKDQKVSIFVPRSRDLIRSGVSQVTKTQQIERLMDFALDFTKAFNISGLFGLQCILESEDKVSFLECNPRVQGTMVASTISGQNLIARAAAAALAIEEEALDPTTWGAVYSRTWSGIGVVDNEIYRI